MSQKLKVFIALFFAMMFWGFTFVWTNKVLVFYNPPTIITIRLIISSLLLILLNLWLKQIQKVSRKDFFRFVILSLFQPFLYFLGENYGLTLVSPTVTSVIISTIPLFSPVAAYFFLKEKISLMNFIGILISIVGVFLLILKKDFQLDASPLGIAFLMLAVFSAVVYSVLVVKLSAKYNVLTITTYQNSIGVLWFIPVFFIVDFKEFISTGFILEPFINILKLAVFGSTVCYLLFIYGIKNLGITRANIFANSIPVFTAIFSYFILGEVLSLLNILGIGIVIFGLMLTQITKNRLQKLKNSIS
jgi:drug/metabolite transporter (DMT)-like permease